LTGRYLLWLKFAKRLAKYSRSSIALLNIWSIVGHLKSSMRSTAPSGANDGLVEELSCCLQLDYGESPLELLSELQKLRYSGSGNSGDAFTSFIDAHQRAGRPVTLVQDMLPRTLVAKAQTFRSRHSLLMSSKGATSILEPTSHM
jgi:hypothetical protein